MNDAVRHELDARLANKANYLFAPVPLTIAHAPDLTRLDVAVWSAYFARERLNVERGSAPPQLSLSQIAFWTASRKPKVTESVKRLVARGYLEEVRAGRPTPTNRGIRAYRTAIPLRRRRPEFLISTALDGLDLGPDDLDEYVRGLDSDERGVPQRGTGGFPNGERGGSPMGNGKVPQGGTLKDQDPQGSVNYPVGASCGTDLADGDGDGEPATTSTEPPDEYEETDPNGGSLGAGEELASGSRRPSRRRRMTRGPIDPLLRRPSERKELRSWRTKRKEGVSLAARDIVGYFACRHVEVVGRESEDLFATSEGLRDVIDDVRAFTRRWLGGDYERAIAVVDRILERAEDLGMPVSLRYFFTPAKTGAVEALERPRRKRVETPAERNDRRGDYEANKEYWDARAEKCQRERPLARLADAIEARRASSNGK